MREFKYYYTNIFIYGQALENLQKLGYKGSHHQFAIVCKAKSFAEANRIADSLDLGAKCFRKNYTSITGNSISIAEADKYGFIVNVNGTGPAKYVDIHSIL